MAQEAAFGGWSRAGEVGRMERGRGRSHATLAGVPLETVVVWFFIVQTLDMGSGKTAYDFVKVGPFGSKEQCETIKRQLVDNSFVRLNPTDCWSTPISATAPSK